MFQPSKDTREKRQHSTAYEPYSFYECCMPNHFPNVPMHWHSEWELGYVTQGSGTFFCGGETYAGREGDLFIFMPNLLHAVYPCGGGGLRYHALVFGSSLLGAGVHDRCTVEHILPFTGGAYRFLPRVPPESAHFRALQACAGEIFSCSPFRTPAAPRPELLLKSALLRFFWLLETEEALIRPQKPDAPGSDAIRPALEYMMHHFREPIRIPRLAALSHMSRSRFTDCFRKAAGMSAAQYIIQLRINAACEMLTTTDEKIAAVALSCGYENLSNFNRQFKAAMGVSPRAYRERCRGQCR